MRLFMTGDDGAAPHSLLILAEEELVAVDLLTSGWPCYELPYLSSIHASAILSATHAANVPQALWDRIKEAGDKQRSNSSARVSGVSCIPGGSEKSAPCRIIGNSLINRIKSCRRDWTFFVKKLTCPKSTIILSVGMKYCVRDLICDVNCSPRPAKLRYVKLYIVRKCDWR